MKVFKSANNRINWVDYYKAFSIFLIVLSHSILEHVQLIHFLYLFHVPLVFFISGYLEKTEDCNAKNYLEKMIYTLIIPYFLWNILCVIFVWPITIKKNMCTFCWIIVMECGKLVFKCSCDNKVSCSYA